MMEKRPVRKGGFVNFTKFPAASITTVVTSHMLTDFLDELVYRMDMCCVSKQGNIEHL